MWKLSHFTLMLVFGDGVLRPHHVGRGCWEFKNRLASFMIIAPFSQADREHVNTAQVVELVLKNHRDTIQDLSIALEWSVKTVPNIVHVKLWYSSVCAWWVPRNVMEIQKNWCLEVLFHFFCHIKEEQSMVMLWDMGSLSYSKWALIHRTHPLCWQPQNVKCASKLEGCGICILYCRSH